MASLSSAMAFSFDVPEGQVQASIFVLSVDAVDQQLLAFGLHGAIAEAGKGDAAAVTPTNNISRRDGMTGVVFKAEADDNKVKKTSIV